MGWNRTDGRDPCVAPGYWCVERHDGFWLEAEEAQMSNVSIGLADPNVTEVVLVVAVDGGGTGKLQE